MWKFCVTFFYVETVPEMGLPEDTCLLARCGWYGMRDAGQAFEFAVRDHFLDHDFKQGMFSSCVFAHRGKFLLYFVHGDDYVGLGVRGDLEGYKAKLSERFITKDRGILGADGSHEIRIFNRVITHHPAKPGCPEMLTYEADQRHTDLLMAAYGLTASSKTKATCWDKAAFLARHPLAGPFLDEKRRVEFRSVLWRYPRQEWTGKVGGLTDSNWAASPVTRKSTSATYFMLGKHPTFAASSTQTIFSLSSGEAEFYGAVRCACRTLGLKSLMSDLSLEVKAELVTDSSACKGLCSRRGAGKIRHIHCPALWLQHAVARQIAITRRAGKNLAPDVATKAGTCLDWPRAKVERSKR